MVAIPCLAAQVFLQSVTKKIVDEIDQYSVKLENLLISRFAGVLVRTMTHSVSHTCGTVLTLSHHLKICGRSTI